MATQTTDRMREIKAHYRVDDAAKVGAFLQARPQLGARVVAAAETLREHSDAPQLTLQIAIDPELGTEQLCFAADSRLDIESMLDRRFEFLLEDCVGLENLPDVILDVRSRWSAV